MKTSDAVGVTILSAIVSVGVILLTSTFTRCTTINSIKHQCDKFNRADLKSESSVEPGDEIYACEKR